MRTEQAPPVRLEEYRPPAWRVETVHLDVSLHPTRSRIRATLALVPNGAPAPLVLDGDGLELVSLQLAGKPLAADAYVSTPDRLTIAQPPAGPFQLTIETEVDPTANTQLSGLYRSGATYCTQCEAEGFRRITYFPDRPDVMAVYTTRIEAERDDAPVLLANGNLLESGAVAGTGRHYAVWHDPFPKPSYLFALVGGDLVHVEDRFRTMSGREVALRIYVEPGKQDRCSYAMESLKRAMAFDERAFGREYDLDVFMIVAVSDFNLGAMENKGLNIFNDKYVLASPETATDEDYARIEAIIAHEYFHNWTGNRITCRDWFQLCLKEGLTVYRDQEFTAQERSRPVKRIADVRTLRAQQFAEDAGPLAHPVRPSLYHEINNFYTATVYEKGAEIVRMIATLIGPAKFRAGMDLYFSRHDGEAATVEQFICCFADVSDLDMAQFMLWYGQAGTPDIVVGEHHDPASATYRLDIAQSIPSTPGQSDKAPMLIPFALGLIGPDGHDLPLTLADGRIPERGVLRLTRAKESFVFTGLRERPVPSLNRDFAAPVRVNVGLSFEDLAFLAARDGDPFNRWQALQTLATRLLLAGVEALRRGETADANPALAQGLAALLQDDGLEPAFVAQALALPSEADIARELGRDVDPDAIHRARRRLRSDLAHTLGEALERRYRAFDRREPYRPDAASAGRRALRNASLDLMTAGGDVKAIALAAGQYRDADNMTDRIAALATLTRHDVPERSQALDDFAARYADEPLVIDKWLALQAAIPEPATLDRVRALTAHRSFSFANPNRVRALIGTFAQANQTQFNRADGAGYAFVAETVLALDARNPQLAARLLAAFKSWRMLETVRLTLALEALRHVARSKNLSPDVGDIARRALGED